MLKLAFRYMRYYKSQTAALFLSVVLTAALLSGMSSLLYSSRLNDVKNNKEMYGDWHYFIEANKGEVSLPEGREVGEGFQLERCGRMEVRDALSAPYEIYFLYGDETYRELMHRDVIAGTYPAGKDEIAADRYTLGNLGFSGNVGDTLTIEGRDYLLTGILKNRWAASSNEMELFVGEAYQGRKIQTFFYLHFSENEALYRQMEAFQKEYKIEGDAVSANDEVVKYLEGEKPDSLRDILKFALTDEQGNFTYVILKLQSEYNLAFRGMAFLLCLFSLFVIYSIFSISVSKRTEEYGMMQTLGIADRHIAGTLVFELWILLSAGYPLGCFLGNNVLRFLYDKRAEGAELYTAWNVIYAGFLFLFVSLGAVGFFTVFSLRRQSAVQAMQGDLSFAKRRRMRRLSYASLADVVVRRFLFANKRKALGIILSLSLGGCLFLCTIYMVENLKVHAEMSLKSDDGLGSEYRISMNSNVLSDMLPETVIDEIRDIPELETVYGVKYILGELSVHADELNWKEYFKEKNEDAYFQQAYGGICVKKDDGTYGIKYDVYGYDVEMLNELQEFILEGEIDQRGLHSNEIIAAANMDGQGNYMFYGKHPGDTITLRVPRKLNCEPELLRFQSGEENYVEKEFKIAAIVSRALAKEDQYLNVNGWNDSQSLILTNDQMEREYGITGFSFAGASSVHGTDIDTLRGQILEKIQDTPRALLKDYISEIAVRKAYLGRQQTFFVSIAVILLLISLFHIMNSMNYSILACRREYGIMRAMGITDAGFMKVILRTGILYGLLADVFILLFYHLVLRRMMDYYMTHVVQFLHLTAGIPDGAAAAVLGLNLLITAAAVAVPARKIIKSRLYSCL